MKSQSFDAAKSENPVALRRSLSALDRKNWWHWWNTVLVILLLVGAIAALSLPKTLGEDTFSSWLQLDLAVRGLLGLVLVFNVYMLYQQHLLRQLRGNLANQMEVATEERVRAEAYYELSILDPLTSLYNRRFSNERLQTEISRAERNGYSLMVLLLDLDNFKGINDCHGHSAGDLVLQEFARRLNKGIRGSDIAVRLGGDEFFVILPECSSQQVGTVLGRLGDFRVEIGTESVLVSSSWGWAQYRTGETPDELIRRADEALYSRKAARTHQEVSV